MKSDATALNVIIDEAGVEPDSVRSALGTLGSAIDRVIVEREGLQVIRSLEDLTHLSQGGAWEIDFQRPEPTSEICAALGDAILKWNPESIGVRIAGGEVSEDDRFMVGLLSEILISLKKSHAFIRLVSCPTCARCRVSLMKYAQEISDRLRGREGDLTVAVMGCEVNGPGEAKMADIGIAFGLGAGLIFKKGEKLRKVQAERAIEALMEEVERLLR